VSVVSTVGRQQPSAGIRARLLNRGAYRWYFGTIFGLIYQIAEFVYVWTNGGSLGMKLAGTGLLVFFYLCYVALPPLIWPQAPRFRIIAIVVYWLATFALLPFIGVFTVWVWTLVAAMVPFCWLRLRTTIALGAMVIAAQGVVALVQTNSLGNGTAISPFVTVSVLISLIAITNQIAANRQLRDAQATIATLAAAEERARLARDLHDVLGHSLTVVAVKSELAGRLVERDPKKAAAEINDIEQLARTALADLRAAVSSYRDMNLDVELTAARTALDAAGIHAHLPLDASAVDEDLRSLFGWVLREGVTNVIRHSKATECWVDLRRNSLSVRDDGLGIPGDGKGNGLTGLNERALEAGAKLTASNGDTGGFLLTVARSPR
jgi:two-component system sensor histidine kinase DesK